MKKKYTIVIGADHRGFALKEFLINKHYNHYEIVWIDVGTFSHERTDYPEFALAAVDTMEEQQAEHAVLLCATGIGMAVVANRFSGIYAGVAWNAEIAQLAKEDDNINVLVLPSDYVTNEESSIILDAWLSAKFKHGRYEKRIAMIDAVKL